MMNLKMRSSIKKQMENLLQKVMIRPLLKDLLKRRSIVILILVLMKNQVPMKMIHLTKVKILKKKKNKRDIKKVNLKKMNQILKMMKVQVKSKGNQTVIKMATVQLRVKLDHLTNQRLGDKSQKHTIRTLSLIERLLKDAYDVNQICKWMYFAFLNIKFIF